MDAELNTGETLPENTDIFYTNVSLSSDEEDNTEKEKDKGKKKKKKKMKKVQDECLYHHKEEPPFFACEENILEDALYVYDYVNRVLGIEE